MSPAQGRRRTSFASQVFPEIAQVTFESTQKSPEKAPATEWTQRRQARASFAPKLFTRRLTRIGVDPSTIQVPLRALRSSPFSCQRLFRSSLVVLLATLFGSHFVAGSFAEPLRESIREPLREPVHRRLAGVGLSDLHDKLGALWDMASRVSLNGTVIIASSNAGFEDMLENWVLHLERVGLGRHFIVFAADSKSLEFAHSKWPGQAIHLDLSGQFGQEERADVEGASVIGTAAFHRVASHRAIYIHHLLSFGFSVLYSDIDIAFLHNPLPFFQKPDSSGSSSGSSSGDIKPGPSLGASAAAAETITDFDMFLTHDRYMKQPSPYIDPIDPTFINGQPLFCSCFLFFRPTLPAKSLVGNWAFRMAKLGRQGGLDQDQLNLVMQWMLERKVLPRIGVLPPLQFPSGQLMKDHWGRFEEVRPRVVMVHANYLTGKVAKIKGLKKAGLWRVKVKEQGNATAAAGAAASRAPAAAAAGKGKGDSDKEAGVVEGNEEEEEKEDEEEEEEPVLLFPMPRRPDEAGEVDSLDETPGMLERGREEGRAGGKGKVGEARVGEPLAGGGGEGGGASGGSGGEGGGDWEAEVLGAVEPWVGEHLGEMEEKGMRIKGAAGMVIVTVACDGQEALFRNWFTHVGRIPSLGNIVLASVPPQMSMPGGHVITRSSDSVSPRVARATCLLLPPLILARLLAANVTVVYSDINSVWLRDPRRYFPPSHSLVLPSLSHQDPPLQQQQQQQQQPDTPPAQGAAENRQQAAAPAPPNTTALAPSLLGSLSPWLMALRPSPAVQAMVHRWAVGALRGYVTAGAAAARGGSGVFSGPEVLSTALNHAVVEMVRGESLVGVEEDGFAVGSEGAVDAGMEAGTEAGTEARTGAGTGGGTRGTGDTGASVGVLPEQLFPPGWRAVGDRAWLEAHRREIVAVQVSCREDGRQQEVCLRDMKLWL